MAESLTQDWFARKASLAPGRTAIIDGETGEAWTYAAMNERAKRLAGYMSSIGIGLGDRVALLAPNHIGYFDALFACMKLGAMLVPLNWRLSQAELDWIVQDSGPKMLLFHGVHERAASEIGLSGKLQLDGQIYRDMMTQSYEPAAAATAATAARTDDPDRPCLILYTGGTTGKPKGVVLTQRSVQWNAINTVISWSLAPSDVTATFLPMFHTGGINALCLPVLLAGGTVVITREHAPDQAVGTIVRHRCTVVLMVPTMYHALIRSEAFRQERFPHMHTFISGGAPCPASVYDAFAGKGLAFKEGYGLTEAGPNNFYIHPDEARRLKGSVGQAMLYNRIRLVDGQGADVPQGETGEIWLSGPHLFDRYWNQPEATAEALRDGWLRTGDLARRDAEGNYYLAGRKKEMIITGGENIYPLEIEQRLQEHPEIEEAAVVGVPDEKWGELITAVVALRPNADTSMEELRRHCAARLGSYKIPKRFVFVDELPKTNVGKIDKKRILQFMIAGGPQGVER